MPANASKVCSVLSKLLVFTAIVTPQELDQQIRNLASLPADSLRDVPAKFKSNNVYEKLAELERYSQMQARGPSRWTCRITVF